MADDVRPVVYISYGWITSQEGDRSVRVPDPRGRELADHLRREGVDARLAGC